MTDTVLALEGLSVSLPAQAGAGEHGFVLAVELVAVAVALGDLVGAVGLGGEGAGLEDAGPGT